MYAILALQKYDENPENAKAKSRPRFHNFESPPTSHHILSSILSLELYYAT
jgi:hypothetical protein